MTVRTDPRISDTREATMANRIRLEAGTYRAVDELAVYLMLGESQVNYRQIWAGETFDVPRHVNGFWSAVTYHPEFGDAEPRFERVAAHT